MRGSVFFRAGITVFAMIAIVFALCGCGDSNDSVRSVRMRRLESPEMTQRHQCCGGLPLCI